MITDSRVVLHVGLDDVDSQISGCTTHFTYAVVKELFRHIDCLEFIDYPNLVRLNPSIPFKTRGNAAVALRFEVPYDDVEKVIKIIVDMLEDYTSDLDDKGGSEPGIAVLKGNVPEALNKLYLKALTDYVHVDYLRNVISEVRDLKLPLGITRGVIGALAAIGWIQGEDCTYELIAYRSINNGGDRCVDVNSVREADIKYRDYVFNNYDHEDGKMLITPHGGNPVLLGIRGEDPEIVVKYFRELNICETYSGYIIFRTNQGTDSHLIKRDLSELRPYRTCCVEVALKSKPLQLRGGDVIIKIEDNPPIYAVFYNETSLSSIARKLDMRDELIICGSVKQWSDLTNVINVEKIHINRKVRTYVYNPKCPKCGRRMKSAGLNKGFKCGKCGFKSKEVVKEVANIVENVNKTFITKVGTMKHLTKPQCRYGKEKQCNFIKPINDWIQ
ncbi:MAG: tRNA(Ile)(2)-agmatinylcytidine synthase [Sulfolobales archaeon]|nr:tRNA(Ile)(2)-agmatinylcytidine synthase [Sulfolobales archaeon]MDW7969562.1 tRNA(Ile)(2)-agmatinylcytidine synthase [Sulfolobales archaeon]